jgi:hypothetical protein
MVHTPTNQDISSERQKVIDWLISHNYPVLPVAPAQSAWKYYKIAPGNEDQGVWAHCPVTADLQPIPLYTGKNPSFIDVEGHPHLINHRKYQKRLPKRSEIKAWFTNPSNGVGTLGGWNNTVWLDFDVKQFPTQEECDTAALSILKHPELEQTFIERSHSGGWRIGIKVKQKPKFTNFSLTPGGSHIGEALFEGRFTVLAPTIGPSGNPYQSIQRAIPVEVESMDAIGIYSTKKTHTSGESGGGNLKDEKTLRTGQNPATPTSFTQQPSVGCIPLEMLGNDISRDILHGNCPTGSNGAQPKFDRSEALTTATKEWYGWQNWAQSNGISIFGDAVTLAHYAGTQLGLDFDRINRILHTIDPVSCHPAALYRGGEESCWKKVYRLDKATFKAKCPAHIQEVITTEWGHGSGNGSGGGGRPSTGGSPNGDEDNSKDDNNRVRGTMVVKSLEQKPFLAIIRNQIKDILIQDLPPSELQAAKIRIRTNNPAISEREIARLFETIDQELEREQSREHCRSEVDNLLQLGDQSLNLSEFLPADLAQPLTQLAHSLNIRPEVCLTSLLVAVSSLHKTKTELVIHKGQGFSVPPTLFAGLVSESGQKKSPILKAIIKKPLSVIQREKREAYQQALTQYEKDIVLWDRCKSKERSEKFPQGKPKSPQQRLYYFTNATGEGLLYQFQAHPDKALLALVDELAGLFASQNKYTGGRGSDRQDILSAFDGTGATVLRAAGTKADLDGLLLSIYGTIQPDVLKQLMKDCSDPDGQWARFLFVNQPLAAAKLADEDSDSFDLTEHLLNYYRAIDQLPKTEYRLSREAFKRYQPVYNQLEQLRISHPSPGMRAVYSKMEGYIGRLALNLHILYELTVGKTLPDQEIPLSIIERAIALAKFYIGQVKLIHANSTTDLGEMAPHLAKVVELSKRMDKATGNSWIKAKTVQSGYDSRHRPRPDVIRSWFRELEALGIGSTRGSGIHLEYSWKLPDRPIDDPKSPPSSDVEKVHHSEEEEKYTISPPTEPTQNQSFSQSEEKIDSPTKLEPDPSQNLVTQPEHSSDDITQKVDNPTQLEPDPSQNLVTQPEHSSDDIAHKVDSPTKLDSDLSQNLVAQPEHSSDDIAQDEIINPAILATDSRYLQTKNSLEIPDSRSPLSSCVDGFASSQTVDTPGSRSLPAEEAPTVSQAEEAERNINHHETTQLQFIVFPVAQHQESRNSDSADTEVSLGWKAVLNIAAPQQNLAISDSSAPGQHSTERQIQVTLEELNSPPELHPKQQISFVTTMSLELPPEQKDPGKSTNTGINTLPLIALVVSAIQKYYSSKASRTGDLPEPQEAVESPVTAEPQVTEVGAEVDPFPGSVKPSYSTGEAIANLPASALSNLRASMLRRISLEKPQQDASHAPWASCFVCCEKLGTLGVMWMEVTTPRKKRLE